jgi:hypothetical protein
VNEPGQADFFLASTEHRGEWAKPRAAYIERELTDRSGNAFLAIRVSPPVDNDGSTLEQLVVGARLEGTTVGRGRRFPVYVYIYKPKQMQSGTNVFDPAAFDLEAWGELYANGRDAEEAARRATSQ